MRTINVSFDDADYHEIVKVKGKKTWRGFIHDMAKEYCFVENEQQIDKVELTREAMKVVGILNKMCADTDDFIEAINCPQFNSIEPEGQIGEIIRGLNEPEIKPEAIYWIGVPYGCLRNCICLYIEVSVPKEIIGIISDDFFGNLAYNYWEGTGDSCIRVMDMGGPDRDVVADGDVITDLFTEDRVGIDASRDYSGKKMIPVVPLEVRASPPNCPNIVIWESLDKIKRKDDQRR